ncbi:hypothetical protein PoB_006459300 [Plakobranchus ocellatus]|uniref:Uncharacterized protein n=1 Tax=Plakobranchus ocellatus TaxID=259542 RepID=A0AAV4D1S7_9GAST|nr:hypothetical protein PoB_006459300 [Plakobranchus ocellatus]
MAIPREATPREAEEAADWLRLDFRGKQFGSHHRQDGPVGAAPGQLMKIEKRQTGAQIFGDLSTHVERTATWFLRLNVLRVWEGKNKLANGNRQA